MNIKVMRVKEYFKKVNPNIYTDFILKNGIQFKKSVVEKFGKQKECYFNAWYYVLNKNESKKRYYYCEGYAISSLIGIPMEHAWVYDKVKEIILEVTWKNVGTDYFGLLYNFDYVMKTGAKSGHRFGAVNIGLFEKIMDGEKINWKPKEKVIK